MEIKKVYQYDIDYYSNLTKTFLVFMLFGISEHFNKVIVLSNSVINLLLKYFEV